MIFGVASYNFAHVKSGLSLGAVSGLSKGTAGVLQYAHLVAR